MKVLLVYPKLLEAPFLVSVQTAPAPSHGTNVFHLWVPFPKSLGRSSVSDVGENVQQVRGNAGRLRDFVQDVGNHTTSAMSSLEACFKMGFGVLLKNLFRGGARLNILPHFDAQRR